MITLFPTATFVPANGQIEIVATVIEQGTAPAPPSTGTPGAGATTSTPGSGTPVHNGTLVSFTTTIGRIDPREARTHNGQVRVTFIADGQSGSATITAFSGGASGLENLAVGSAAIDKVLLSVSPQTLPPNGGTATVQARAENATGAALSGLLVTFSTDNGTLSPTTAITDANGVATSTLSRRVKRRSPQTLPGRRRKRRSG